MRTKLEKDGDVLPIPDLLYIYWTLSEWIECGQIGRHSLYWKPRRMVVSWLAAAFDIWDLLQNPGKVFVAAHAFDGDNGSRAFVWRRWFVYDALQSRFCDPDSPDYSPEWNMPDPITEGKPITEELDYVILPNGAKIQALNSEAKKFRGSGARRVWLEELNIYRHVHKIWGQAHQLTQVPAKREGMVRGTVNAIVNAGTNKEYQELKKRSKHPVEAGPGPGMSRWLSDMGVRVLDLRYWADPSKDEAWVAEESEGIPTLEWLIEMEKDENIYEGEPVFRDFKYDRHSPIGYRTQLFPLFPNSKYFGGWDAGQTKRPAFVLAQLLESGQVLWMFEVVSKVTMAMRYFAPLVKQELERHLPPGLWDEVRHVGDPTGTTSNVTNWATGNTEGISSFEIASRYGFEIQPSINDPTVRQDAVSWMLSDWVNDANVDDPTEWMPRTFYCELGCPVLVEGMKGAYQWNVTELGYGMVIRKPLKNAYADVNDAHQYVAIEVYKELHDGQLPRSAQYANW